MRTEPTSIVLVLVGFIFVLFLIFKLFRPSFHRQSEKQEIRRRITEAKSRARSKDMDAIKRASAWREAAWMALEGLKRPSLAASYARRAERLDPDDEEAIGLLAVSLRRAVRYRALERFLWRHLAKNIDEESVGFKRAFEELIQLYEGPFHRPEMAKVLRRLRGSSGGQ